jgi:hypothetical protein
MPGNIIFAPVALSIGGRNKGLCRIFDLSPAAKTEVSRRIFAILNTDIVNFDIDAFSVIITDEFKKTFREQGGAERTETDNFNAKFETALKNINVALYKFFILKHLPATGGKFNILAGGISGRELIISACGNIRSAVFHKDENGRFSMINVSGINSARLNLAKIFNQIISGEIGTNDIVFCSSPTIFDLLTTNELKQILTESSAKDSAEILKKELIVRRPSSNLAALIISLKEPQASTSPKTALHSSIAPLKKILSAKNLRFLYLFAKQSADAFRAVFAFVKAALLKSKISAISAARGIKQTSAFGKFNALSSKIRVFLVVSAVIIVCSLQIFSFAGVWQKINQNKNATAQKLAAIRAEKETALNSLGFGDEKTAIELLADAKNKLSEGFNRENADEQKLFAEIDTELEKLTKVIRIENPFLIAELPEEKDAKYAGLAYLAEKLYAWNDREAKFYIANQDGRVLYLNTPKIYGTLKVGVANGEKLYFSYVGSGLIEMSTSDGSFKNIALQNFNREITSFAFYNEKLYITSGDGNILKFSPSPSGFVNPQEWLKNPDNFIDDDAKISVSSNIYLAASGEIREYSRGEKTDFRLEDIVPPLKNTAKIFASDSHIYLLDKVEKRLLAFKKDGQLATQYVSTAFGELIDFAVLEEQKKLYFLVGNKIYGAIATHLSE